MFMQSVSDLTMRKEGGVYSAVIRRKCGAGAVCAVRGGIEKCCLGAKILGIYVLVFSQSQHSSAFRAGLYWTTVW